MTEPGVSRISRTERSGASNVSSTSRKYGQAASIGASSKSWQDGSALIMMIGCVAPARPRSGMTLQSPS
jgi:hypothetical protein